MIRNSLHQIIRLTVPAIALLPVVGCGNTLVFVERTGFNTSVAVRPSENLPLEVNFGLDRKIATVVPPAGKSTVGQTPDGEAVNMFAGFRSEYTPNTNPLTNKLTIRTQFASGGAADAIAGDVASVMRVVNVTDAVAHDPSFINPAEVARRRQVEQAITALTPAQRVRLANTMRANLATRSPAMQAQLGKLSASPFNDTAGGRQRAEMFLRIWVQMERGMTPERVAEWQGAISAAKAT